MQFLTINQTAKSTGLSTRWLRSTHAKGNLPGFYAGNRFYVNVEMLKEMLDSESRKAMKEVNEK